MKHYIEQEGLSFGMASPDNIGTWRAMLVVLDSGEHCPHHLHGLKPH